MFILFPTYQVPFPSRQNLSGRYRKVPKPSHNPAFNRNVSSELISGRRPPAGSPIWSRLFETHTLHLSWLMTAHHCTSALACARPWSSSLNWNVEMSIAVCLLSGRPRPWLHPATARGLNMPWQTLGAKHRQTTPSQRKIKKMSVLPRLHFLQSSLQLDLVSEFSCGFWLTPSYNRHC